MKASDDTFNNTPTAMVKMEPTKPSAVCKSETSPDKVNFAQQSRLPICTQKRHF